MPKVYLAHLTVHDFFFYVSRELKVGIPSEYISNTALMYALNTHIASAQRLAAGTKPHYEEDFKKFTIYATPAAPWRVRPLLGGQRTQGSYGGTLVKITYNSVGEQLAYAMETEKINIPKIGAYYRFTPLTSFTFYTVGGVGPSVIRIGKKYVQARVRYTPLKCVKKKGRCEVSHPISSQDLAEAKLISGTVIPTLPYPIILNPTIEGEYFECTGPGGEKHRVLAPPRSLYESISPD